LSKAVTVGFRRRLACGRLLCRCVGVCIKSRAEPSPTCLPGQGGFPKGDAAIRQRNGSRDCQPSSDNPMEGIFMPTREPNDAGPSSSDVTSAGVPWSEVPEFARPHVEWMEGRHGSANEPLPPIDEVPIPTVLFELPQLHENRPRGSKAMIDVNGARHQLADCRPGAWLVSPYTGWRWAKWPTGEVGWVPDGVALPDSLRVGLRRGK
jgi:hypothetical protein